MIDQKYPRFVKIIGEITVFDKDKSGHIIEVAIESEDFEKYIVVCDVKCKPLLELVQKKIKAKGILTGENIFGNQLFEISEYEILGY